MLDENLHADADADADEHESAEDPGGPAESRSDAITDQNRDERQDERDETDRRHGHRLAATGESIKPSPRIASISGPPDLITIISRNNLKA